MIRTLLQYGADPLLTSKGGKTSAQWAREQVCTTLNCAALRAALACAHCRGVKRMRCCWSERHVERM